MVIAREALEGLKSAQWLSEKLAMRKHHVYDAVNKGHIPNEAIVRIGRRLRFKPSVIEEWVGDGGNARKRNAQT